MQAELFETPDNPAPAGGQVAMMATPDGKKLRYARFPAEARPLKGTVVIVTGRNECIEKYFETVRDLSARGFGSAVLDLRGQGGSDRLLRDPRRGYIRDFSQYADDLGTFFQDVVLPDCRGPYYLLAHSMGALVALLAAPDLVNRVRRMVLCAPLLSLRELPVSMATVLRLTSTLHRLGLGRTFITRGASPDNPVPFEINKVTTDRGRYARNTGIYRQHPHLGTGGPTATWLRAACLAMNRVLDPDYRARLAVPTLFVAAGADEVVSTPLIEHYGRRLRAGSVVTIHGARHEILQEADIYREQFFAAFDAFIPGSEEPLS